MNKQEILNKVDHTILAQTTKWEDIKKICDDGIKYNTASVCIPPSYVQEAKKYVSKKLKICTVIGFPNGYNTTNVKVYETLEAIEKGADEIDMVINIGWLKDKKYEEIENEIRTIKNVCGDKILKVIIETCLLTDEEKVKMCEIVDKSGADYIKTSTGFSSYGATFEDIKLFKDSLKESSLKIKAAGGVKSFEDAEKFIELGADRLGTSRLIKLI
ncbi:MAG: deoxyribose-phosphate aldolase [Clostridia bacterium]|nr:deoxyribose-phosphate aldolase [Clostridia bacterium]